MCRVGGSSDEPQEIQSRIDNDVSAHAFTQRRSVCHLVISTERSVKSHTARCPLWENVSAADRGTGM
jgi:hypothetical protein